MLAKHRLVLEVKGLNLPAQKLLVAEAIIHVQTADFVGVRVRLVHDDLAIRANRMPVGGTVGEVSDLLSFDSRDRDCRLGIFLDGQNRTVSHADNCAIETRADNGANRVIDAEESENGVKFNHSNSLAEFLSLSTEFFN